MSRFRFALLLLAGAFTVLPAVRAQNAGAVAPVADDADRLVARFYDITLLAVPQQQFPFDFGSGTRTGMSYPLMEQGGGGGFGGGGQAGGGGGGGFFSLPIEPAQFGGGLGGGTGGYDSTEPSLKDRLDSNGDTLTSLFESNVAPDSWATNGGEGTVTELGNTLLVRQTEKIHLELEEFLTQLITAVIGKGTYTLEVWWLPRDEANRAQLKQLLGEAPGEAPVAEQLTALCDSTGGYHGTLLCRERVTTHTASGTQVPVVVGSIPVVGGGGAAGEQPIVKTLHLGLVLEARLSAVPEYLIGRGDAANSETLELTYRSAITNRSEKGTEWPAYGQIDRYSMGRHVAEGGCRIRLGKPTLIASLTELSSASDNPAGHTPEMLMVVRVTRSEN